MNPGATNHTPTRDLLPTATIYLHAYTGPDADTFPRFGLAGPDQ